MATPKPASTTVAVTATAKATTPPAAAAADATVFGSKPTSTATPLPTLPSWPNRMKPVQSSSGSKSPLAGSMTELSSSSTSLKSSLLEPKLTRTVSSSLETPAKQTAESLPIATTVIKKSALVDTPRSSTDSLMHRDSKERRSVRFNEKVSLVHFEKDESGSRTQSFGNETEEAAPKPMTPVKAMTPVSADFEYEASSDEDAEEEEEEENPFMSELVGSALPPKRTIKMPKPLVHDDEDMFGGDETMRIEDDDLMDEEELEAMAKRLQNFASKFEKTVPSSSGKGILKSAEPSPVKEGDDSVKETHFRARDSLVPAKLKQAAKLNNDVNPFADEDIDEDAQEDNPFAEEVEEEIASPPSTKVGSFGSKSKPIASNDNPFAEEVEVEEEESNNPFGEKVSPPKSAKEDANPFADEVEIGDDGGNANPFASADDSGDTVLGSSSKTSDANPFAELVDDNSNNPFGGDDMGDDEANPFAEDVRDTSSSGNNAFGDGSSEKAPATVPRASKKVVEDNPFAEAGPDDDDNPFAVDVHDNSANPFGADDEPQKSSSDNPFSATSTEEEKRKSNFSQGVKKTVPKPKLAPEQPDSSTNVTNKDTPPSKPLRKIHIDKNSLDDYRQEATDELAHAKAEDFDIDLQLAAVKNRLDELEKLGSKLEDEMRSGTVEDIDMMSEFVLIVNERDRLITEEFQLMQKRDLLDLEARQKVAEYQLKELIEKADKLPAKARAGLKAIQENVEREIIEIIEERNQKAIVLEESKQR